MATFWAKQPGRTYLLGSVLAWGLLGMFLRTLGTGDPETAVFVGFGAGVTTITLDCRYRKRMRMGPFDLSSSTIFTIFPTWTWGVVVLCLAAYIATE